RKAAGFLAGTVVALLPVLWPLARAPRQTWFSVIEYQLFYRHVEWDEAISHDLRVMTSWLESSQALLLGLLSAGGLLYIARASGWEARRKAEFYLCGWLAAALILHLSNAHPTFAQYYLLTVPFLAVLTAAGLYAAGSRLAGSERPHWPVAVLGLLLAMGLAKAISGRSDQHYWRILEQLGRKVEEVTPRGGVLMADEHVYFLTRRLPPSGMELEDSHKLHLPAAMARAMHVISRAELIRRIEAGRFDAVSTCDGEDYAEDLGLPKVYAQKAEFDECVLYWQRRRDAAKSGDAAR
ncbi:MAG TPA: hypothetical protein VG672_07375, partial [Bryobacteraceae bacterium]|nr:hypothetical protein [Bryobacteraceae bacterium]